MEEVIKRNDKEIIICKIHNLNCTNICLVKNCKMMLNCKKCKNLHEKRHNKNLNISIKNLLKNEKEEETFLEKNIKERKKRLKNKMKELRNMFLNNWENFEKNLIEEIEKNKNSEIIFQNNVLEEKKSEFEKDKNNINKLKNFAEEYKSFQDLKKKENSKEFEKIRQIENFEKTLQNYFSDKIPKTVEKIEYFKNSQILNKQEDIEFIKNNLFSQKLKQIKKIYQGSKNGFTSKDFHLLVDNKGATLTIIKSSKNEIFGGFNSFNWTNKKGNGKYFKTEKSFLFSITKKKKLNCIENEKSIYYDKNTLCIFGKYNFPFSKSWDLAILENCDQNEESYSNLGSSYEIPEGMIYRSDESKCFLAGSFGFRVEEIEVYSIDI